jgi:hypothetical protein
MVLIPSRVVDSAGCVKDNETGYKPVGIKSLGQGALEDRIEILLILTDVVLGKQFNDSVVLGQEEDRIHY